MTAIQGHNTIRAIQYFALIYIVSLRRIAIHARVAHHAHIMRIANALLIIVGIQYKTIWSWMIQSYQLFVGEKKLFLMLSQQHHSFIKLQ
jgi:uncharacterized membrane protein YcaP (DUF421 family)